MQGREIYWIEVDGKTSGLVMVRNYAGWPQGERGVAEIAEFYVAPEVRRQGVGSAAARLLLTEHRRRKTSVIKAPVLARNQPALEFWSALGFETDMIVTARQP